MGGQDARALVVAALVAASNLIVLGSSAAGETAPPPIRPQGPPPYVSFPRLERLEDIPAASRGQFVWGPEGLMPAQFVPTIKPLSTYAQGQSKGTAVVSTATDTTNALDSYQGETMLVTGSGLLVGGQNDIYPGNCNAAAATGAFGDCAPSASVSSDGGASWTRTKLPRTWGGHVFVIGFDPSIAFDGSSFFFAYGVSDSGQNSANGIAVVSSPDGRTWTQKTPVTLSTKRTKIFDDKYWIAADHSGAAFQGRLYVGWDRNQSNNQILFVAFSSDGGASWSSPIKVNDGTSGFERVINAYPAVDQRNGTVYMAWHDYARNVIFVDRSMDGGVTWGTDISAAQTHTGFGSDIGCNGGRQMSPSPTLLVGPGGELYLVYADSVSGNGYDVLVVKSIDGGLSWNSPVRVNDDPSGTGRHQYNAGASIDANGTLTVSFYDRRDDAANCLSHVYTAGSNDGVAFTTNELVTGDGRGPDATGQSNYDGNPNGPGDYSGSAAFGTSGRLYYARHVDPDSGGSGGGFEAYASSVTTSIGTRPVVTAISPTSGPTAGGTSVTVTGSNFSGATAVRFGATGASSFAVNSDTQVVAISPAGTGSVDVTVTTPGGTSATSPADRFTYVAPAAPTGMAAVDHPADNGGALDLSWTPSSSAGVTQQRIYRGTASGGPYTLAATIANNITASYTDTGLATAIRSFYVLRAFDGISESANSNEASAIPQDNIAPTVTGTSPANGATGVATTAVVSASFSEPMDQPATQSAFSMSPPASGSFSWSGTTMTFTPASSLSAGTTYTATLGIAARDANGVALASPYSWSFTTAASQTMVTFDDLGNNHSAFGCCQYLNGIYAGIDWGTNVWLISDPWGALTTRNVSGPAVTGSSTFSFTFSPARTLLSIQAYNGGSSPSTVSLACTGLPTVSQTVPTGTLATVSTGWTSICATVTVTSANGWNTNFDNLVYR